MVFTNSSTERSSFPERTPSSPGGFGAQYTPTRPTLAAEEVEAPRIPVLGTTLLFRGELTAEEDVILQGRVEGSIRHARNLIIGTDGSVLGDVYASHLTVEGLVEGDLHCTEAVIVRATAQVRGTSSRRASASWKVRPSMGAWRWIRTPRPARPAMRDLAPGSHRHPRATPHLPHRHRRVRAAEQLPRVRVRRPHLPAQRLQGPRR